jgi:hypothetical protein
MILSSLARIRTALVFRSHAPKEAQDGNVRALAIRDVVGAKPLHWSALPKITLEETHLGHCLEPGDVVIPSRGDYYKAWLFEGASDPVFPLGQLNVITPTSQLDAQYLVWYLNSTKAQAQISYLLTGTNIKALTKSALLKLDIELPTIDEQKKIAEIDRTVHQIIAIRHRLSELDKAEVAYVTQRFLEK